MKTSIKTALLAGLAFLLCGQARADGPLRVCLDPDNPPFSSDKADQPGLYAEISQRLAQEIGRTFQPVYTLSYFGRRAVRTNLLDGKCEAFIGLPEMEDFIGKRVIMSQPVLSLGYALVLPQGRRVTRLSDLDGLRVAVQFASPPESLIAQREAIRPFTVKETAEAMDALASGQADAAFIWGPTAGYINKTKLNGAWQVVPVHGKGMQWEAAIGFPSAQAELREQVDAALAKLAPDIAALEQKYGFPAASAPSVDLARLEGASPIRLAAVDADEAAVKEAPATEAEVAEGRELFNTNCSHCHGPDGVQAERRINLKLLEHRYGERMDEVYTYTTHHGRPDKGMPNWSGIIPDSDLAKIKDWLHTVQQS